MPSFDSIVVGEDWISEHYFTTDSTKESFQSEVLKLRKQWDQQAKEGHESVLKRFLGERGTFQVELAELLEEPSKASAVYHKVREALGFKGTTSDLTTERAGTTLRVPNVWKSQNGDVLFLESRPVESVEDLLDSAKGTSRMLAPTFIDDKEVELPAPKLVSELYRTDEPPQFIVVLGGRWLLLTQRERWAEGRYLAADLLLACERNDTKRGGEIDRVLAIFGRESLLPDASEAIWWNQILESSVKHTIGVSKDLREGIRLSIEIIANDVLRRREALGLPLDEINGQILARQSLRYLYRILFLLYAEASPEMGVLPVGVGEYNDGYGLDRLRELALNVPESQRARSGTHIYQSLGTLFRLVDQGHRPSLDPGTELNALADTPMPAVGEQGLHFDSLKADLFDPKAMADIDLVGLSNSALQKVLEHLLLSKELRGRDRGFISYAELGVNQLGAVYEGLMSYTGFIAETDLHEVAKDGDSAKGSWVVPVARSESIQRKHFVTTKNEVTGELEPVLHEKGTFVFRLAGRERQQSASYYTPEALTRFVVSQALEELLDQGGKETVADEILDLTVCEPALGSGAFAIEAVRQLADEYLKRKQKELNVQIPAEDYAVELQKVKAQIALHQVYGVDLNSTAVELAEVSLWLDTMVAGLQAPWFGLHLKPGNSLIGARRATYSRAAVNDKSWLTSAPADAPLSGLADAMANDTDDPNVMGRIHHFLLPAAGWGAAADAKEVKDLAGDAQTELKLWRSRIKAKPSKSQLDRLVNLGRRVETLWQFALRRLEVANSEVRRDIDYFGRPSVVESVEKPVSREEIEQKLSDPNGAYRRLRRVMDAWNALWFWPLTSSVTGDVAPPNMDEWIAGLESILGLPGKESKVVGQTTLHALTTWSELNQAEELDLGFAGVSKIEDALAAAPWMSVCQEVAEVQGFFHWELEFASVFAVGGFDLQVGNPPWVRPDWNEKSIHAEFDPWWQLASKPSRLEMQRRGQEAKANSKHSDFVQNQATAMTGLREHLTDPGLYPTLRGLRPDLYRCFMERTWRSSSKQGCVGLIHPESHFTEEKASEFRRITYSRLRRHWQFKNKKKLFEDLTDQLDFGVHIYGAERQKPEFMMAASLYQPDTAERSLLHDGTGTAPALKTPDGEWDTRPHSERIIRVDESVLDVWAKILDAPGTPASEARMMYPINVQSSQVLVKFAEAARIRDLNLNSSTGWNETTDRKKGYFNHEIKVPSSWDEVILQGPHLTVATPFAKIPREVVNSNNDWDEIDLEALASDYLPRTLYQPDFDNLVVSRKKSVGSGSQEITIDYDAAFTHWTGPDGELLPSRNYYRLAWRRMAALSSRRTLHAAVLPPGASHLFTLHSAAFSEVGNDSNLLGMVGTLSSLPADFFMKVAGTSDILFPLLASLPRVPDEWPLKAQLVERAAKLVCLTSAYAELWKNSMGSVWTVDSPLRNARSRRKAEVELDALVSIMLGISADALCMIYRTQFPVLQAYEKADLYDANGRKLPIEMNKAFRLKGELVSVDERSWIHPQSGAMYVFELPFIGLDREADMRQAHAHFTELMKEMN
jgi:hypothetical protein